MTVLLYLETIDSILKYIKLKSIDAIIGEAAKIQKFDIDDLTNTSMGEYLINTTSESQYLVIKEIKENIDKYEWLYHRLDDKKSKDALLNLIRYKLTSDISFIKDSFDLNDGKYFYENNTKEKMTDIKIDVENEEIKLISESTDYIKNESPNLAIYLHDISLNLWQIIELIDSINDRYDFYIRYYYDNRTYKIVLYAILNKNIKHRTVEKKGFYLIPYTNNYITNVRLTKDFGLIPYFMYKKQGYNSVIVSEKHEDWQYLDKYVKGLNIDISNVNLNFNESMMNYIARNYNKMDCIMLFGLYISNFNKLKFYKTMRPNGKVYLKLDANSGWMDSIDFNNRDVMEFLNNIDVISVESKEMKKYLSSKIKYKKIEYIPNGYFNYSSDEYVDYRNKENTIITAARLGTYQKNNEILLEAFKLVADEIPDWNLKLIGNIEESFYEYIENYFEVNPDLRARVMFMGNIDDKEALFDEYRKSKIFVLTSRFEGGSPNVYSEAAFNGNYIITSKIDACMDMTNNLECGDIFDIGDILELASILLKRCKNQSYIESKCNEIQTYIRTYFNYERLVFKLDYLLNL